MLKRGVLDFKFIQDSFRSYESHLIYTNSFKLLENISRKYHEVRIAQAVQRGGNWNNGANAGPFAANLNNEPTNTNTNIGFRCCQEPATNIKSSRRFNGFQVHRFIPSFTKTGADCAVEKNSAVCNELLYLMGENFNRKWKN